jgi:hypothetical protein
VLSQALTADRGDYIAADHPGGSRSELRIQGWLPISTHAAGPTRSSTAESYTCQEKRGRSERHAVRALVTAGA